MHKKILITLIGGIVTLSAWAQQDASFSMYFFNPMYYNPAYAGSRGDISGTLVHRSQWVGVEGAPATQSVNVHGMIPDKRLGLGLQVYNDVIGPIKNTSFQLAVAYHLPVGKETTLSFGLQGSLNSLRIAFNQIKFDDQSDQSFINNNSSALVPDASAGLYLYNPRFYAALSSTHLLQPKFGLANMPSATPAMYFRNYYLTSGLVVKLNDKVNFRPSVMLSYTQAAPVNIGVNASFIFYQKLFVGLGTRLSSRIAIPGLDDQLIAMVEYEIGNFMRVGYAFDVYLNPIGRNTFGTHEIMLGWDLNLTKTKMTSPRFF
jgi:type IX secretion system PorP/SprF family membrane protein